MPNLKLNAVAFMSPQNHPILIKSFNKQHAIKYHYIAHTSLDVIEERGLPILLPNAPSPCTQLTPDPSK